MTSDLQVVAVPRVRRARFKVRGLFDGRHEATVLIEDDGHEPRFTVWPKRARRAHVYTVRLADVAAMVHARVVKAQVAAKMKARKSRGKRGRT